MTQESYRKVLVQFERAYSGLAELEERNLFTDAIVTQTEKYITFLKRRIGPR